MNLNNLYRKRPVVVEAIQWNAPDTNGMPIWVRDCKDHPMVRPTDYMEIFNLLGTSGCSSDSNMWSWEVMGVIDTLEGKHVVTPGDFIIKGVDGEYYACKPDIFWKTYDKVEIKEENDMKKYVKFVYSQEGIDELKTFAGDAVDGFRKYRSPNAVGMCLLNGNLVVESDYVIRTDDGFVAINEKEAKRLGYV